MVEKPEASRLLKIPETPGIQAVQKEAVVDGAVVLISDKNYQAFLRENPLAVLVLASTLCPHCLDYQPTVSKLAKKLPNVRFGIAWLDKLPSKAQVQEVDGDLGKGIPVTFLIKEGWVIARLRGDWPFEDVEEYLRKHLIQGLPIPPEELLETFRPKTPSLLAKLKSLFVRRDGWKD